MARTALFRKGEEQRQECKRGFQTVWAEDKLKLELQTPDCAPLRFLRRGPGTSTGWKAGGTAGGGMAILAMDRRLEACATASPLPHPETKLSLLNRR